MKSIIIIGLFSVSGLLWAQNDEPAATTTPPAEPLGQLTQPVDDATSIKVIVEKNQTIEEYRQKGELILVKVIPNDGVPYFIDPLEREKLQGTGRDLINSGVKPVRWVIKEF